TSAPLLQRWFSSTDHPAATDPYFLYGASNLGSMLALLGYPVLVEPYLSLKGQQLVWVVGYGVLALLIGVCAVLMWRARPAPQPPAGGARGGPRRRRPPRRSARTPSSPGSAPWSAARTGGRRSGSRPRRTPARPPGR